MRGGREARVVVRLVPPLDDLAAVEADGLPVAGAGGNLDGAADQQIRGERGLVGADDLVAGVGVVVAEEDEGEILGQRVVDLLVGRVLAVRVDGVHVEVAAEPGERRILLAAVAEGVKVGGGVVWGEPRVDGVEGHFDIQLPVDTVGDGFVWAEHDVPDAWLDGAGIVAGRGPGGRDGEVVSTLSSRNQVRDNLGQTYLKPPDQPREPVVPLCASIIWYPRWSKTPRSRAFPRPLFE